MDITKTGENKSHYNILKQEKKQEKTEEESNEI